MWNYIYVAGLKKKCWFVGKQTNKSLKTLFLVDLSVQTLTLLVSQRPTFHWSWALCPQVSSGTTFNAINRSFIFRKCSTRGMLQKHVSILGSVSRLRMCERRQILNVRQLSECCRWVKEQVSRHYDVDDGVKPISSQQQQQSSWWIQLSAPQVNRYVLSFIIRIETFKFVSCCYIEIEVENNIEFERLG